jgi:F-type H+-transporting ATPase subunit gamma
VKRAEGIRGRIDNIRQIEAVVSALRALAVAHRREAERHLGAIRSHAATISEALRDALAAGMEFGDGAAPRGGGLLVVVGAAQGFGGAYGDRIAEAALAARADDELMVIGHRTAETLEAQGVRLLWSADMAAHAADVPALASRLADAAFERLAEPGRDQLAILHAAPAKAAAAPAPPARRSLVPFDYGRFPPRDAPPPLTTLPRAALIAGLVREYVFTELCEGLALGFAAENEARAAAMARAQSNISRIEDDLGRAWRRARQEGMTEEIVELALHGGVAP